MQRTIHSDVLCKCAVSVGKKGKNKIALLLMTVDQRLALTKENLQKGYATKRFNFTNKQPALFLL